MKFIQQTKTAIQSALKWAGLVSAVVAGLTAFINALPDDNNEA